MMGSVHAQWTENTDENTLVVESEATDMKALGTSTGETYVVFWKSVAAPTNFELRMQVLDADGNQTLGEDGMLVSDQIPMSTFTVLWNIEVDEADNLYIGVTGTGGGDPAFAFKLDAEGNFIWDENGVSIGSGNVVTILPLSSGGALISWLGSSGAVMQAYDETGMPVWTTTQPIAGGPGFTIPGNFFEISGGDFIAIFHSSIGGINTNLYAQRYDSDGLAQWTEALQLSDKATVFNRGYEGVQDGDIVYMSYFGASNNRFDAYLQRINPDGTIPWGINGVDFDMSNTFFETTVAIAFDGGASAIYAVSNYTDATQNMNGLFIQKFDKNTGAAQFTENAKSIYTVGLEKVHQGGMHLLNGTPWLLVQDGVDNGASPVTLNAVYLDENGDFAWDEETRPVATFSANKSRIQYTAPVDGQSVAVFVEDKGTGEKIYAQNVEDETLGLDEFAQNPLFYSNPVKDEVRVQTATGIEAISIYNILGQKIFSSYYNGQQDVIINAQSWQKGMYVLSVKNNNGTSKSVKLVKE